MRSKIISINKIPDKKELKKHLQENHIPVKFNYIGNGAKKWNLSRKSKKNKLTKRQLSIFKNSLLEIKNHINFNSTNLIHLGTGDGIEIPFFFKIFDPNKKSLYSGIDISKKMIYSAIKSCNKILSKDNSFFYLSDIEKEGNLKLICKDIKTKGADKNIIIGTNEGTLFSNPKIFKIIKDSMNHDDYFFFSLESDCKKKRKEILSTYNLNVCKNLLSVGLKKAGINPKKGNFKTIFNERKSSVEVYFQTNKGKNILCLDSYKPTKENLVNRLSKEGFKIIFFKYYKKANTIAVLCSKKRYR